MSEAHIPQPGNFGDVPQGPEVRHERTDVDTRAIVGFVAALGVGIIAIMLAVRGLFALFMSSAIAEKKSVFSLPASERASGRTTDTLPPQPRLEGIGKIAPEHSVGRNKVGAAIELSKRQESILNSYGWIDAAQSRAHIPIAEAMKRILTQLPARKDGRPVDAFLNEPSQTSSGREPRGSDH